MKKIIKCGQLFTADGAVKNGMAIAVEDGRITAVEPADSIRCEDAEVIDLSDKFVMPGLIEAHSHIGMSGGANINQELLYMGFGEITVNSIRNAQADMMAGFTTLRDEASYAYTDVDVRNLIDRGVLWGPRMRVSGICISATGGHGDLIYRPGVGGVTFPESHMSYIVNGPDEAAKAARTTIKYGADVVKLMATGGVLSNDANPGAADLSYAELKAACDVAKMHDKLTSAHAHGAAGIKSAIEAGIDSIEHGMLIDDEGIEMLKERGVYLIPTVIAGQTAMEMGRAGGLPPLLLHKAEMCMERVNHNLHYMRQLGVKVGFGTDVGTPGNPHGQQLREFELMMEYGGYTSTEVLLAATRVNSELLRWSDQIGSIEAGKLADIIAFDESPVENIKNIHHCSFVMKNGTVYKKAGQSLMQQIV